VIGNLAATDSWSTARRYRTAQIQADNHVITAADSPAKNSAGLLEAITRSRRCMY
jgi:hypothetical protein